VRRIAVQTVLISLTIVAAALPGKLVASDQASEVPPATSPEAEQSVSLARDAEIAQARTFLTDLFISEKIDQIDFRAETYEQGMAQIHAAVDEILEKSPAEATAVPVFADHARQVIEALNSHKPKGLALAYGENVKAIVVLTPGDGRLLGEIVSTALSIIQEEFGESNVSYFDPANKLFRSVVLDTDEGPLLGQYVNGIRLIAELPPPRRSRYLQ